MMSTQLKELAKQYNLFIFSSTQLNAAGMEDDGYFKNEMCLRGAKSLADALKRRFEKQFSKLSGGELLESPKSLLNYNIDMK